MLAAFGDVLVVQSCDGNLEREKGRISVSISRRATEGP